MRELLGPDSLVSLLFSSREWHDRGLHRIAMASRYESGGPHNHSGGPTPSRPQVGIPLTECCNGERESDWTTRSGDLKPGPWFWKGSGLLSIISEQKVLWSCDWGAEGDPCLVFDSHVVFDPSLCVCAGVHFLLETKSQVIGELLKKKFYYKKIISLDVST